MKLLLVARSEAAAARGSRTHSGGNSPLCSVLAPPHLQDWIQFGTLGFKRAMDKLGFFCLKLLNTLNPRNEKEVGIVQTGRDSGDPSSGQGEQIQSKSLTRPAREHQGRTELSAKASVHKATSPRPLEASEEKWGPCQRHYRRGSEV